MTSKTSDPTSAHSNAPYPYPYPVADEPSFPNTAKSFIASLFGVALSFIGTVYAVIGTFAPSDDTVFRVVSGIIAFVGAAATIFFFRKMLHAVINA